MKFYIKTFGCRANASESDKIAIELQEKGHETSSISESDIILINSCAVTNKAIREVRQYLNQTKKINPKIQIYLTGCAATLWIKNKQIKKDESVRLVSNISKLDLVNLLAAQYKSKSWDSAQTKKDYGKFLNSGRLMVKIQDGCDYFCTFCIVPYLRGRSISYHPKKITEYINRIDNQTRVNEVIITGINLGLYNYSLPRLLSQICKQTNVTKISYGSLYPENISQKFLQLYQTKLRSKLSNFFHIPLQSACPRILKLMNRRYTIEEFDAKVRLLKKQIPDALISTDIIVGFISETEKDFLITYDYLKNSSIVKAHIFPYSQREHTTANLLAKQFPTLSVSVKKQRALILRELFKEKLFQYQQRIIGQTKECLILKRLINNQYLGILNSNLEVIINTPKKLAKEMVNVKIVGLKRGKLVGQQI